MFRRKNSTSFNSHWNANIVSEISSAKLSEARSFLRPLYEKMKESDESIQILDVGCGDGVHSLVLLEDGIDGHRYFGLDISLKACRLARERVRQINRGYAAFHCGDVSKLPYRSNSFEIVFSYGVLAYTDMPEAGFDEMVRVSKPGGLVGLWLYPKPKGLSGKLFNFTRSICHLLGRRFSKLVVYTVVLFLPFLPVRSGINLFNSTLRQCVEVVEVNLLPDVLEFYALENILEWFYKRDLKIQLVDPDRSIAVWARVSK